MRSPSDRTRAVNRLFGVPPDLDALARLICLPHAGGGVARFYRWGRSLPSWVQVCPVSLPGREARIHEPPYSDMRQLVNDLTGELQPFVDRPYALFGHSMGALVAFEISREMRGRGIRPPSIIWVVTARAPDYWHLEPDLYRLPEDEFVRCVGERYGAIPTAILADPQMRPVFLSIIRSDFELLSSFRYVHEAPLACPIAAFGGRDDAAISEQELSAWSAHTTGGFTLTRFPGGHFFPYEHEDLWIEALGSALEEAFSP